MSWNKYIYFTCLGIYTYIFFVGLWIYVPPSQSAGVYLPSYQHVLLSERYFIIKAPQNSSAGPSPKYLKKILQINIWTYHTNIFLLQWQHQFSWDHRDSVINITHKTLQTTSGKRVSSYVLRKIVKLDVPIELSHFGRHENKIWHTESCSLPSILHVGQATTAWTTCHPN